MDRLTLETLSYANRTTLVGVAPQVVPQDPQDRYHRVLLRVSRINYYWGPKFGVKRLDAIEQGRWAKRALSILEGR